MDLDFKQFATNGIIGGVIAIVLIKAMAVVIGRFGDAIIAAVKGNAEAVKAASDSQVEALRELRSTMQSRDHKVSTGLSSMIDRISRIEGKIEGIAMARAPEMSDASDRTPVHMAIPQPHDTFESFGHRDALTASASPRSLRAGGNPIPRMPSSGVPNRIPTPIAGVPVSSGLYMEKKGTPKR